MPALASLPTGHTPEALSYLINQVNRLGLEPMALALKGLIGHLLQKLTEHD